MCGIAGFIGRDIDPKRIHQMTKLMTHRGPDSDGFHFAQPVTLGMRRLAIIDRDSGKQPIFNETKDIAVVYNGEVYNHQELRLELVSHGHVFQTEADTEVLVHGYEQWGIEGLLNRLNGMFAFAIHDTKRQQVFVARDRIGIKPLYYYSDDQSIAFASEVKTFRALEHIPFRLNRKSLPDYLSLRYVPEPATLFEGISKLGAGHFMIINEGGGFETHRYWNPNIDVTERTDQEYLEQFNELFDDAVKIRLMSEVPVGAYLSEGLDSNMIVSAMARELPTKPHTYSMGFGGKYDETESARISAATIGSEHTEITFDPSSFSELPDVIWALDEPIGDAHILPSYILAREAKKSLTVVLLGEGADESLYGYPFYKVSHILRSILSKSPSPLTSGLMSAIRHAPLSLLNSVFPMPAELGEEGRIHLLNYIGIASKGSGQDIFRQLSGLFSPNDLSALLKGNSDTTGFNLGLFDVDQDARDPDTLLQQISEVQFSGWLQDNVLLRHDKVAMAHSVECRVPFLDHRLVEFMQGVPRKLKVSGWRDKVLSRRYARSRISPDIAKRPKKPFYLPLERFLDAPEFQDLVADNLSPERIKKRDLFHINEIQGLLARMQTGDFLAIKRVMSLVILELWMRTFIDGELAPSANI